MPACYACLLCLCCAMLSHAAPCRAMPRYAALFCEHCVQCVHCAALRFCRSSRLRRASAWRALVCLPEHVRMHLRPREASAGVKACEGHLSSWRFRRSGAEAKRARVGLRAFRPSVARRCTTQASENCREVRRGHVCCPREVQPCAIQRHIKT